MKKVDKQRIIQEYQEQMRTPLSWLYYERVRYFEECGDNQYDGLFHESISNSAKFFGVSKEKIVKTRGELYRHGLGKCIPFSYQPDDTLNKMIFASYPKIKQLVSENKIDPKVIEDLEKRKANRLETMS